MGMPGSEVRVHAFAKINLDLRVLGVRADGYHTLRTTFQTIELHDTLTIRRVTGAFRLTCSDPDCPVDESNLVWRAADLIWRAARRRGVPCDADVRIEKRIPMQAGLAGGSSNAAAALGAFAAFWRVRIGTKRLQQFARRLGADVPFFLEGGTALGTSRGDRLMRQPDQPSSWVVLALPNFGVSTKEAFDWWDRQPRPVLDMRERRGASASRAAPRASKKSWQTDDFRNDLEYVIANRHPEIGSLVEALQGAGATRAMMSGSGSAVFGLFDSRRAATQAAAQLRSATVRAIVTRTITRTEFHRLSHPVNATARTRRSRRK